MKPSFALNLTDDGVTLLHRTSRGWMDVGQAAFSDPDLPAALDYLRSTAMGLSPKGIATKLVIPNDQILYTEIHAPGPTEAERRAQIEKALDGRTPYDLSDLVYDWSGTGPDVMVAVVAKETLATAESFATEHRLNPVSFVAIPEVDFGAEPFFGASSVASTILPGSQKVERDSRPVQVVARDLPKPEPEKTAEATERSTAATTAKNDPETNKTTTPGTVPEAPPPMPKLPVAAKVADEAEAPSKLPELSKDKEAEPKAAGEAEASSENPTAEAGHTDGNTLSAVSERSSEAVAASEDEDATRPETEAAPTVTIAPGAEHAIPKDESADSDLAPETKAAPANDEPKKAERPDPTSEEESPLPRSPAKTPEVEEAPMAVDVPGDEVPPLPQGWTPRVTAPIAPTIDDDMPPAPSNAARMAFASRRMGDMPPPPKRPAPSAEPRMAEPPTGPIAPPATRTAGAKAPTVDRPAGARPPPKFSYDDPVPPPPRMPGDPPVAPAAAPPRPNKGLKSLSSLVTSPGIAGTRPRKPAPPKLAPQQTINPSEGSGGEINPDVLAKGLGARSRSQRGKPRYLGLILTGILLLFLAVVAAWSSLYLSQATPTEDTDVDVAAVAAESEATGDSQAPGQLAAIAEPDAVDPSLPTVDEEAAADGEELADTEAVTEPVAADATAATAPVAVEPEVAAVAAPSGEPVATAEPVAAAPEPAPETGVDAAAADAVPPQTDDQDEIFLAGMDVPPSVSDPLTLTPPAGNVDALPDPQMLPPPFGTVYQFDADGRIVPTAEGIETPDGAFLIAGKPPVLPPQRPDSITAAAATSTAATAPVAAEVGTPPPVTEDASIAPADTFAADPALADSRPRSRPQGLAPAAPAAGEDDASLAPAEDSRFASIRPRLRPKEVLAAGEASRLAAEQASLAAQAAIAAATEAAVAEANSDGSISPLAVSVSRVPAPRPRDLTRAVEAAVAAATQPSSRTPAPTKEEEEADAEPDTAKVAPRIPTKASVAKQATYVNAINLSKINLIGVYGTQSKRYALIRQSNGRYKKVKIGDSFDGGTIKAITASEVRYQKGGRLITLSMPKG